MYAPPENYLEVEVGNAQTHGTGRKMYTDYQIITKVRFPVSVLFPISVSSWSSFAVWALALVVGYPSFKGNGCNVRRGSTAAAEGGVEIGKPKKELLALETFPRESKPERLNWPGGGGFLFFDL
jgi:hypothetical protein